MRRLRSPGLGVGLLVTRRGGPSFLPPPPVPLERTRETRRARSGNQQAAKSRSVRSLAKSRSVRSLAKPVIVTITGKNRDISYTEILGKAKEVSLGSFGINNVRMHRAMNGALVIEIPGPDGKTLAGTLRENLEEALRDEAIVNNPVPMGEISLRGIDPSTTVNDILPVLADLAGCTSRDVRISEIAKMRDGMGIAWVHCPLEYATKVASVGSINLGWTVVRMELQRKKPVQCFRCWRFGHVRSSCKSAVDRAGLCFRCGRAGHTVRNCAEIPRCAVCAEMGKEHAHRLGSPRCLENQGFKTGVINVKRDPPPSSYRGGGGSEWEGTSDAL